MPIVTPKEKVKVVIMTSHLLLEGDMHVVPGGRLLDEVNKERAFLPVTGATVYDANGEKAIESFDFITVNKNQVIFIAPVGTAPVSESQHKHKHK